MNAASKVEGFNFDDSDEEQKQHTQPLDQRGTEVMVVKGNKPEEDKIFEKT